MKKTMDKEIILNDIKKELVEEYLKDYNTEDWDVENIPAFIKTNTYKITRRDIGLIYKIKADRLTMIKELIQIISGYHEDYIKEPMDCFWIIHEILNAKIEIEIVK